jgi:hypothetical protein
VEGIGEGVPAVAEGVTDAGAVVVDDIAAGGQVDRHGRHRHETVDVGLLGHQLLEGRLALGELALEGDHVAEVDRVGE